MKRYMNTALLYAILAMVGGVFYREFTPKIREYNGIKMTVEYEIVDDKTGMVHCRGLTKHCFLNSKGRPVSLKKDFPDFHEMFVNAPGMEQKK